MLASKLHRTGLQSSARPAAAASIGVSRLPILRPGATHICNATAWTAWDEFMVTRGASRQADGKEQKNTQDIAAAISKSAVGYKPRFTVPAEPHAASFKLQHVDRIQVKDLPKDLHDRMETIGLAALKTALGTDGELDFLDAAYTTTDIDAALAITGTTVQVGGEKSAVLAFVVCETERQASWSRLEGLILHWACGTAAGGPWSMPPDGWSASPKKTRDAGGAWQCQFEKQTVGNNEQMYVLLLQVPLKGVLKSGGLVFVIKGTLNQADRWLKDAATDKDFFLDLQKLPISKM